jgi:hypothetical protein
MRDTCYLIFSRNGIKRMVKRLPSSLGRNEYAILIKLDAPMSMFQQRPFEAILSVDASQTLSSLSPAIQQVPVRG